MNSRILAPIQFISVLIMAPHPVHGYWNLYVDFHAQSSTDFFDGNWRTTEWRKLLEQCPAIACVSSVEHIFSSECNCNYIYFPLPASSVQSEIKWCPKCLFLLRLSAQLKTEFQGLCWALPSGSKFVCKVIANYIISKEIDVVLIICYCVRHRQEESGLNRIFGPANQLLKSIKYSILKSK